MAKNSNALLGRAGIRQKLRLAIKGADGVPRSTGIHNVVFVEDKLVSILDRDTQQKVPAVKYVFRKDGQEYEYTIPVKDKNGNVHYLIQNMAPIKEGTALTLECKHSGKRNYIDIRRIESEKEPGEKSAEGDVAPEEEEIDIDDLYGEDEPETD